MLFTVSLLPPLAFRFPQTPSQNSLQACTCHLPGQTHARTRARAFRRANRPVVGQHLGGFSSHFSLGRTFNILVFLFVSTLPSPRLTLNFLSITQKNHCIYKLHIFVIHSVPWVTQSRRKVVSCGPQLFPICVHCMHVIVNLTCTNWWCVCVLGPICRSNLKICSYSLLGTDINISQWCKSG